MQYKTLFVIAFVSLSILFSCGRRPSSIIDPNLEGPQAPTGLTAQAQDSAVTLSWNLQENVKFKVYIGTSSGSYVDSVETTSNSYFAGDLENDVKYYFAVKAVDYHNRESQYSEEVSAVPLLDAGEPYSILNVSDELVVFYCRPGEEKDSTIRISNSGNQSLSFSSQIIFVSGHLSLSPSSGTVAPDSYIDVILELSCAGLNDGIYEGTLRITAEGAVGSPKEISIEVNVSTEVIPPRIEFNRTSISFKCRPGWTDRETLRITNPGTSSLNYWEASVEYSGSSGNWITSIRPSSGSIAAGESTLVDLRASCSGLNYGTYHGTLTVSSTDEGVEAKSIPISLKVYYMFP